jgi:hypothetical protein
MLERAVALAVLLAAGVYLTQALALPYGTTARPGAGFFPIMVALFTCAVGLVMTAQAFLGAAPTGAPDSHLPHDAGERARVLSTIAVLVAFCLLMPWVGYPVAAFAFVAFLLRRLGSGWRPALIIGALSAATSHYLFAVLLDVPLPRGPW